MRNGSGQVPAARQWRPDHRATSKSTVARSALANTSTPQARQARLEPSRVREPSWSWSACLRLTSTGSIRIDRDLVAIEAHLDGKFLLRTSDESLSAEDVALGYKALYEAERGWRDMKKSTVTCPVTTKVRPRYEPIQRS